MNPQRKVYTIMENYLGKKIRELRRAKDLTQEQLADYLNISYQSVSKWETGTAAPDLSYIIPLARLFDISTDELLGFEQSKEDLIKIEYLDAYNETWKNGDLEKRLQICLDAVRDYPGDMEWLKHLAMAHSMHCYSYEDNERYQAERAEAIKCYEIVIENTPEGKLREEAIAAVVQDLSYAGRKEEARKYALLYPEDKRDEIEGYYLEGEAQAEHRQKQIKKAFGYLLAKFNFLNDDEVQIMADLVKLFYPDENYLDESYIMYRYELILSRKAVDSNNLNEAIAHLKTAKAIAAYSDKIEYAEPGIYHYTNPLFDKLTVDTNTFLHTEDRPLLLCFADSLKAEIFAPLRERKDFLELVSSLK